MCSRAPCIHVHQHAHGAIELPLLCFSPGVISQHRNKLSLWKRRQGATSQALNSAVHTHYIVMIFYYCHYYYYLELFFRQ